MKFESIPNKNSDETALPDENEIKRRALKIEALNYEIEATHEGSERDKKIEKLNTLEEELNRLETLTGLSGEEILNEYENLTAELAVKNIDELLAELEPYVSAEEHQGFLENIRNNIYEPLLAVIQEHSPKKLALASACVLLLITNVAEISHGAQNKNVDTTQSVGFSEYVQAEQSESRKENFEKIVLGAEHEADMYTKHVLEKEVTGFPQIYRQKLVVDELADKSPTIIAYIKGDRETLPELSEHADKIFKSYRDAVLKVEELGNETASKQIREIMVKKMETLATKNYDEIKKIIS